MAERQLPKLDTRVRFPSPAHPPNYKLADTQCPARLGKKVGLAKLQSFVLGAMLAAVPSTLYAHHISFIDPTSFTISESIFILSILIVGGLGNLWGSLAATAFMILVPEALRFVGLPGGIAANVRQILYGACLVIVIWMQISKEAEPKLSSEHPQ